MPESEKLHIPHFIARMAAVFKTAEKEEVSLEDDDQKIKVNRVIGKVSLIYEKLRNVVDYNDEHLLRKNAIFRILKRLIIIERKREVIGMSLIREMIRINYLPNNTLPESRAREVDQILLKYLYLGQIIINSYKNKDALKLFQWFLQIASCEVEEVLFDFSQRKALTIAMGRVIKEEVELPENISEGIQNILFNLTVLRSLLKSDEEVLYYYLLSELNPWFFTEGPDPSKILELVKNWPREKAKMDYLLFHPLKNKLGKIGRKYAVYFLILRDVLQKNHQNVDEVITRPKILEKEIAQICNKRYREIRTKVVRSVIRSVVYIFITKMTLALLIEMPLDFILEGTLNSMSLLINILFPPFLMLAISLFIYLPKQRNTEYIIKHIKEIVYQKKEGEKKYHLRSGTARYGLSKFLFNFFYFITYGITFGLVIYFLYVVKFNVFSSAIFIFFLCVVSFFAVHIRQTARELIVLDSKEGFINLLFDFFSLPIVRIGQWLSIKLSKINIFVFVLDLIIEAPLKTILEVIESWFSFVREKKEEIY